MLLNCDVKEDSWEPLRVQGDPTSPSYRKSVLNIHWKDWCCSWNSNTLATWWEELTHLKRPWCWERLKVGGEGDTRGWDGWATSLTQWTWVWVNSGSWWWWTGRPGMLQSDMTEQLNWTELNWTVCLRCQDSERDHKMTTFQPPWGQKLSKFSSSFHHCDLITYCLLWISEDLTGKSS